MLNLHYNLYDRGHSSRSVLQRQSASTEAIGSVLGSKINSCTTASTKVSTTEAIGPDLGYKINSCTKASTTFCTKEAIGPDLVVYKDLPKAFTSVSVLKRPMLRPE